MATKSLDEFYAELGKSAGAYTPTTRDDITALQQWEPDLSRTEAGERPGVLPGALPEEATAGMPALDVPDIPPDFFEKAAIAAAPPPLEPAFTMSKQPDAPKARGDEDVGWWTNTGYGLLNRLGDDLLTNFGDFGEAVTDKIADTVPLAEYTAPFQSAKWIAKGIGALGGAIGGNDYRVRGDWETVENSWAKVAESEELSGSDLLEAAKQTGEFMLETGVVSLPDMAAMIVSMPAYIASRTQELAAERAESDGRKGDITREDYAVGALTATVVSAIDKFALNQGTKAVREALEGGFGKALKRIAGGTAIEAGQEAVQEGLEYTGTTLGTEAGFDPKEARRAATAGAVGGAGFGAAVNTGSEVIGSVRGRKEDDTPVEPPKDGDTAPAVTEEEFGDDDSLPTQAELDVQEDDIIAPPEPKAEKTAEEVVKEEAEEAEKVSTKPVEAITQEEVDKALADAAGKEEKVEKTRLKSDEIRERIKKRKEKADEDQGDTTGEGTSTPEPEAEPTGATAEPETGQAEEAQEVEAEVPGVQEEQQDQPTETLGEVKFTKPEYRQVAEEAGLTAADLEAAARDKQERVTKGGLERAIQVKNIREATSSKSVADVLAYVETNLGKDTKYNTEKTGRTRRGDIGMKVGAVQALVREALNLTKKSTAPQEVIDRTKELYGKWKDVATKMSAEAEQGKAFSQTYKGRTLDPIIDELVELVQALDQNRASEFVGQPETTTETKSKSKKKEATPVEKLSEREIYEAKEQFARKRDEMIQLRRQIGQTSRLNAQERNAALEKVGKAIAAIDEQQAEFDRKLEAAVFKEGSKKTDEKRGKKGEKVDGVMASSYTADQAKGMLNELGVPKLVTEGANRVADLPVNPNNTPYAVGLYSQALVESKAGDNTKLNAVKAAFKAVLAATDNTAELARQQAAIKLGEIGVVHKSIVDDFLEMAENSRVMSQSLLEEAETINEGIRETAAEQDFDLDQQEEMDASIMENLADTQSESTTVGLSDEWDYNERDGVLDRTKQSSGTRWASRYETRPRELILRLATAIEGFRPATIAEEDADLIEMLRSAEAQYAEEMGKMIFDQMPKTYGQAQNYKVVDSAIVINAILNKTDPSNPYYSLLEEMFASNPEAEIALADTAWFKDKFGEEAGGFAGIHTISDMDPKKVDEEGPAFRLSDESVGVKPLVGLNMDQSPAALFRTFVHEMVHHHTVMATTVDNEAAVYMDEIRKQVFEQLKKSPLVTSGKLNLAHELAAGDLYGLTNLPEFLAEAFSNPTFQRLLASIPVKARPSVGLGYGGSLFDAFLRGIKKLFGRSRVKTSVLDEVVRVAPELWHDGDSWYGAELDYGQMLEASSNLKVDGDRIVSTEFGEEASVFRHEAKLRETVVNNARESMGETGAAVAEFSNNVMFGTNPSMKRALNSGSERELEGVVKQLQREWGESRYGGELTRYISKVSLGLQTMDQILRNHAKLFKTGALNKYMDIQRQRNRIAARWQQRGAAIDQQWEGLSKKQAEHFTDYVNRVTMAEVHPDRDWDKQKHLFSKGEQKVYEQRHRELRREWNRMGDKEKRLFENMRTYFIAQRKEQVQKSVRYVFHVYFDKAPDLADQFAAAVNKAGSLQDAMNADPNLRQAFDVLSGEQQSQMEGTLDSLLRMPKVRGAYFPLRRFGDYVVQYKRKRDLGTFSKKKDAQEAVREWKREHPSNNSPINSAIKKDDAGNYKVEVVEEGVEFFEGAGPARKAIRELGEKGWTVGKEPTKKQDWSGLFDVGAAHVLNQAAKKFNDGTKRGETLQAALETAFIEVLAENNIRKSTLQRKNVRGASAEGRRVFAERVFAGGYALADTETMFDQAKAMDAIWEEANDGREGSIKRGEIARELMLRERHNVNDRRSSVLNDWVGQLGFLGFLAGPSYPIINATQPFMVGLPWLGARYGWSANKVMARNVARLGPAILKELVDSRLGVKRDPHQAVQNAIRALEKANPGAAVALRTMRDMGIIDSTFIDAVAESAKGKRNTPGDWTVFKIAASAPKVVEVMNRAIMASTAYELEMSKSGDSALATEMASEAILQTQFDYSDFNKPRFFKYPVARPFLLFKMYPQGIYGLMHSSVKQALGKDSTTEEKKAAYYTMLGLTTSHTIMGGALGGLFMEPVRMALSLMEVLWQWDDPDEDMFPFWDKQRFDFNQRRIAAEFIGNDFGAELVMRGIPRAFGVDLSGRLGLHNLMFMGTTDDGRSEIWKYVEQLGGAPLGAVLSWERGYNYMKNGQVMRGLEAGAPKALRDIMGVMRASENGLEDFRGKNYFPARELDGWDHFVKMMGFSPAKTAELMEERYSQMSYDRRKQRERGEWLTKVMTGGATWGEMEKRWNAKNPDYRITYQTFLRAKNQQMTDEMLMYKGYPVDIKKPSIREQARF